MTNVTSLEDLPKKNSLLSRCIEFLSFVAVGSLAAFANLISRYFLSNFLIFEIAVLIAYLIGMVIAFYLFQKFIFGKPNIPVRRLITRFSIVNLVGAFLAILISSLFARLILPYLNWDLFPNEVAHFIGVSIPAISSYFGHKYYTFK